MDISSTGDGLLILLKCKPFASQGWMAFASWYSISKNLPDASVVISCERGYLSSYFNWCFTMKVPFFQHKIPDAVLECKKVVELPPYVMAVREYNPDSTGPVPANSKKFATFVDYSEGVGNFVLSEWIHTDNRPPFERASKRWARSPAGFNEEKIFSLWERSQIAFSAT